MLETKFHLIEQKYFHSKARGRGVGWFSGCGTVDRAVATETKRSGFESCQRQLLLNVCLQLLVEKKKINKKRPGITLFKKSKGAIAHWICLNLAEPVDPGSSRER